MKKIDNINEFIEKIDNAKKANPLDLSSDQDLSIAIMNLISIEEHLFFSGAKTGDNQFYDLINNVREYRKELLGKIIKSYKGEVWCISKHLLASSMRLSEVGTKLLHSGNKEEAYDLFNKAYDLYCLFWGLNINHIDESEVKNFIEENKKERESKPIAPRNNDTTDADSISIREEHININDKKYDKNKQNIKKNLIESVKNFVTKAVNCCRE